MGTVAAIGERIKVAGLAVAGVAVVPAEQPEGVRRAWESLPADVALVILTPAAARALGPAALEGDRLTAVLPDEPAE